MGLLIVTTLVTGILILFGLWPSDDGSNGLEGELPKPLLSFRAEVQGKPFGPFGSRFKIGQDIVLTLSFNRGFSQPGILEFRLLYASEEYPLKQESELYHVRRPINVGAPTLRIPLKERPLSLGTYTVEVWWHQSRLKSNPKLLGAGQFMIN
jgi:hypothetical protein